MKQVWQGIPRVLLSLCAIVLCMAAMSALAEQAPVYYLDGNGETQVCKDYISVTDSGSWEKGKWYVVDKDIATEFRYKVSGTANLILLDGKTLEANKGINLSDGNTLRIYAGNTSETIKESGSLKCHTQDFNTACIGGNYMYRGGDLTINGGNITAIADGGGSPGIGGGFMGGGCYVVINGGKVLAIGGEGSWGIGSGRDGNQHRGLKLGMGVMLETSTDGKNWTPEPNTANRTRYMRTTDTLPGPVSYLAWNGRKLVKKTGKQAPRKYNIVESSDKDVTWRAGDQSMWYVVRDKVTIDKRITVEGEVKLILCNGAKLTAPNGIRVGKNSSLDIYAQCMDKRRGILEASAHGNSHEGNAAIGGSEEEDSGPITIHGGRIIATADSGGAGIGGGAFGDGDVTIHGGLVTATGACGAGIGGGTHGGSGSEVVINGGTVTATSLTSGAGIGGGAHGSGGKVHINAGKVTANGSPYGGAGIGSGTVIAVGGHVVGGDVIINGGKVFATAQNGGAAIGAGSNRVSTEHGKLQLGKYVAIRGGESSKNPERIGEGPLNNVEIRTAYMETYDPRAYGRGGGDDGPVDIKGVDDTDLTNTLFIPTQLKQIEAEAFRGISVSTVYIPSGCISIGKKAFADCSNLQMINIPDTVTSIGSKAFDGCPNLTIVTNNRYAQKWAAKYKIPCITGSLF